MLKHRNCVVNILISTLTCCMKNNLRLIWLIYFPFLSQHVIDIQMYFFMYTIHNLGEHLRWYNYSCTKWTLLPPAELKAMEKLFTYYISIMFPDKDIQL